MNTATFSLGKFCNTRLSTPCVATNKKVNGGTKSNKRNKWGKKAIKINEEIFKLREQGRTIREITEKIYYWDKNNHRKFVSVGFVHKALKERQEGGA